MKKATAAIQEHGIGAIIQKRRIEQGVTQDILCDGLCSLPTMSRIETGAQRPSRALAAALLQRLGVMDEHSYLLSFEDRMLEDLKLRIKSASGRFDYRTALLLVDELEGRPGRPDSITLQFIILSRATNGRIVDGDVVQYSSEERLEMLNESIRCTIPAFDCKKISNHLLSLDEMIIAMNIANLHGSMGEHRTAIELYRQLLDYANECLLPLSEGGLIIPLLTYNYSKYLEKENRNQEALEVAELGISCCVKYRKAHVLGELYINKACALHRLGRVEEGQKDAIRSYYLLDSLEMVESAKAVKDYLNETYGYVVD